MQSGMTMDLNLKANSKIISKSGWEFLHFTGVQGLLHAFMREERLQNLGLETGQKIA
jgi:hypothetical protein